MYGVFRGNYPRDLTNFLGILFFAFRELALGPGPGWDWKNRWDGWMFFHPRSAFFSEVLLLVYVPTSLPLLDCLLSIQ